jgi:nitrile hydratase accessory protein
VTGIPDLGALPPLPRDEEGPVFREPWEAQAFAMALRLHEGRHFDWREWASHLAREIAAARERGDPDTGETYYQHWLAALERMAVDKGLVSEAELARRREEWEIAARETPHGQPIELRRRAGPSVAGEPA